MMLGALAAIVVVVNGGQVGHSSSELTARRVPKPAAIAVRPPLGEQDAVFFDW